MPHLEVLAPAFALVALTIVVWLRLYQVRIREMRVRRIDPQSIALSAQKDAGLLDTRAADNFNNLFQLPVLFYVAVLLIFATSRGDGLSLALAWAFVGLRVVHSLIQCTYNRVMHRFFMYATGALVLWALWGLLAVRLFA